MQTIKAMLGFPNGTPIDAVTARITKTYKRKDINTLYGPKTIQDGYLEDGSGGKIKFKAWSHPDLSALEGKEFVIHADGKGKGLKVVHENYTPAGGAPTTTVLLEVGKSGEFQHVVVYEQTKGLPDTSALKGTPAPTPAKENPVKATGRREDGPLPAGKPYVHGATAGAAHNKAVDILIATGHLNIQTLEDDVVKIGGALVRAAQRLEAGDFGDAKTPVNAEPAKPVVPAPHSDDKDEDVPF